MVKSGKHSVSFDEDERQTFLKKFDGSKSAKNKKNKKKLVKGHPKKTPRTKKKLLDIQVNQDFNETKYDDIDNINDLEVIVTTKTFNS